MDLVVDDAVELTDALPGPRRHRWLIVWAVLAGTVAAGAFGLAQAPRYTATTQLLVGSPVGASALDDGARAEVRDDWASALARLSSGSGALNAAQAAAGVAGSNPEVDAGSPEDSPMIRINVTADSLSAARRIAAAYLSVLQRVAGTRGPRSPGAVPPLSALQLTAATAGGGWVAVRDGLVGGVIGLVLGLAGVLVLDDRAQRRRADPAPAGVRDRSDARLQPGVRIRPGARVQSGVPVQSGVRIQSGVPSQSGVLITLPDEVPVTGGVFPPAQAGAPDYTPERLPAS